MHTRSKQWHLIDYSICHGRDIRDVRITSVMRGTECWNDLCLIRSVLSLHITPTRRNTAKFCRPVFHTAKLKQLERSRMFAKDLDDRLTAHGPLSGPPPQQWEQFKTLVTESAKLTSRPKKKVHQDWFDEKDERIKELLDDKKKAFIEWQNDISSTSKRDLFKHLQRQAQAALHRMRGEWWENKANEIASYSGTKNYKFSSAPSRKSTALPSHAPRLSCQLTAQPCLRRKATLPQGGGNTSIPCSTDPPLWTPLCSTRSHRAHDQQPQPPPNNR